MLNKVYIRESNDGMDSNSNNGGLVTPIKCKPNYMNDY